MPLTDEIKNAAQALGSLLHSDTSVQEYLRLAQQALQDRDAVALETRYEQLYNELSQREQNGEALEQAQIDEYYDLKRQIQWHPVIAARENQLDAVRAIFSETSQPLSAVLKIDYPGFIL